MALEVVTTYLFPWEFATQERVMMRKQVMKISVAVGEWNLMMWSLFELFTMLALVVFIVICTSPIDAVDLWCCNQLIHLSEGDLFNCPGAAPQRRLLQIQVC